MLPHPNPTRPWESVPKDISGLENTYYLITIDNYSDFYALNQLSNTQSSSLINHIIVHLAIHGIPFRCLLDNGGKCISITRPYKQFAST